MQDEILDAFDRKPEYTDADLFGMLWTQPRRVLTYIYETGYDKHRYTILILAGIARNLGRIQDRGVSGDVPMTATILSAVILGGLLGWTTYYIYAALVAWMGKWLGGRTDTGTLFCVLTYALVPAALSVFLYVPQYALIGDAIFQNGEFASNGTALDIALYVTIGIQLALSIASVCYIVVAVSVVQEFTIGRSIVNALAPIVFVLAVVGTFVGLAYLIAG